jgi:hypothetical protein
MGDLPPNIRHEAVVDLFTEDTGIWQELLERVGDPTPRNKADRVTIDIPVAVPDPNRPRIAEAAAIYAPADPYCVRPPGRVDLIPGMSRQMMLIDLPLSTVERCEFKRSATLGSAPNVVEIQRPKPPPVSPQFPIPMDFDWPPPPPSMRSPESIVEQPPAPVATEPWLEDGSPNPPEKWRRGSLTNRVSMAGEMKPRPSTGRIDYVLSPPFPIVEEPPKPTKPKSRRRTISHRFKADYDPIYKLAVREPSPTPERLKWNIDDLDEGNVDEFSSIVMRRPKGSHTVHMQAFVVPPANTDKVAGKRHRESLVPKIARPFNAAVPRV